MTILPAPAAVDSGSHRINRVPGSHGEACYRFRKIV